MINCKTKSMGLTKKTLLFLMMTAIYFNVNTIAVFAQVPAQESSSSSGPKASSSHFGVGVATTNTDANNQVGALNEILASVMSYAGAVVIVIGVIKLIISIKEEDAGSKVQAFMVIMGGFVFLMAKAIVKAI